MKSFNIKSFVITGVVVPFLFVTCLVTSVHAIIMSGNDGIFGAGSLTQDTDQMLEFLDVTESTGRSFIDVSGQFGMGGDFAGFRHATQTEVLTLVNNFGFSPGAQPDMEVTGDTGTDQLSGLVNLLGVTASGSDGEGSLAFAGTCTIIDCRIIQIFNLFDPTQNDVVNALDESPKGAIIGAFGHYLVRETPHTTVPIPDTLMLFGLGFTGFVVWRYRAEKLAHTT